MRENLVPVVGDLRSNLLKYLTHSIWQLYFTSAVVVFVARVRRLSHPHLLKKGTFSGALGRAHTRQLQH